MIAGRDNKVREQRERKHHAASAAIIARQPIRKYLIEVAAQDSGGRHDGRSRWVLENWRRLETGEELLHRVV